VPGAQRPGKTGCMLTICLLVSALIPVSLARTIPFVYVAVLCCASLALMLVATAYYWSRKSFGASGAFLGLAILVGVTTWVAVLVRFS
jgi:hypothetical protein